MKSVARRLTQGASSAGRRQMMTKIPSASTIRRVVALPSSRAFSSRVTPLHSQRIAASSVARPVQKRGFKTSRAQMGGISQKNKEIIKSTAPVLAQHGYTITKTFYKNMFAASPYAKSLFNQGHQVELPGKRATQPHALATAVHAYAANIDHLENLTGAVAQMVHKHVSLHILPDDYGIVGKHLLEAIPQVLGGAATPEVLEAWKEGYGFLADLLINEENALRQDRKNARGGWEGWRDFSVTKKVFENPSILSLVLHPTDGKEICLWKPGQYCGIRVDVPGFGTTQRNYSVSCMPNHTYLKLTVHRENAPFEGAPPGMVSNWIHDSVEEGDLFKVTPPVGTFYLSDNKDLRPRVFVSGGVGITPHTSMLQHIAANPIDNQVHILRSLRDRNSIFNQDELTKTVSRNLNFHYKVVYDNPPNNHYPQGPITVDHIRKNVGTADAEFYITGPRGWMNGIVTGLKEWGVKPGDINYEYFGPLE